MITYVVGNLLQSPARVLVNTVNTVGVMGKGIAKDFKTIYPEMFRKYQQLCESKQFDIGQLWLYKTDHKWILNFPTKKDWKQPSKVEYIEAGLKKFSLTYADKGITSIAFPMLGCGNGGLKWENEVRPLMEQYLNRLPIDIYVYLYRKDPFETEHMKISEIKSWLRREPESLPFVEVWEDLAVLLDKKNRFSTLVDNIDFEAKVVDKPDSGIEIDTPFEQRFVSFQQMVELWHHVRSVGFLIADGLPNELERLAPYLIAVFRHLPYLKPVLISSNYDSVTMNSIGLRYFPTSTDVKTTHEKDFDVQEVT